MTDTQKMYTLGVMRTFVDDRQRADFNRVIDRAIERLRAQLKDKVQLDIQVFDFRGPHLTPASGAYSPLDYLQIGLGEKIERNLNFLLIVTEVDLLSTTISYALALPSQLANVAVLSLKRLSPKFWGADEDEDEVLTSQRLATLMLHTSGHLLNLPHAHQETNVMYDFQSVQDLDRMQTFEPAQAAKMAHNLPNEACERYSQGSFWRFVLRMVGFNLGRIGRGVWRANPLRLITHLPTMITAGFSVVIVLFFSAETWDLASSVATWQLFLFSLLALSTATLVLYQAFGFGAVLTRGKEISESTVVTEATILISLMSTLLILYTGLFMFFLFSTRAIFPRELMETWSTTGPAVTWLDHVQLSLFLAAMGVLAGSLGGRADSKQVVRKVIFLDEET